MSEMLENVEKCRKMWKSVGKCGKCIIMAVMLINVEKC